MSDLDEFKANNKPNGRISKIAPHKDDILNLKSCGYSTADVVRYLKEYKKLTISTQAVNNFLKKQKEASADTMEKKKTQIKIKHHSIGQPTKKENTTKGFVMGNKPLSELMK